MRESEFTHWIPDYFFEGPTITAIEGRSRQDECLCTNTQGGNMRTRDTNEPIGIGDIVESFLCVMILCIVGYMLYIAIIR